jgi:EAL domain-containing protein (putative c-di-GMP-specific phosphodiesterase class I)
MESRPDNARPDLTTGTAADPLEVAADAATVAARDARTAAGSAADTSLTAGEAAEATAEVARHARVSTAAAVAAAAASTALLAVETAAAVRDEAAIRAVDAAASAAEARDTIVSELPVDADPHEARQAAVAVADAVAAEVVARSRSTADAATLVAEAVTAAAEAAFVAARSAAATVELAADMAAASGRVVAGSSAATHAATDVVVASTARAAELGPRLRLTAATLRRFGPARDPLVGELLGALERAELRLHYQPIYDLKNGALSAVEALLRWQHSSRGLLSPAHFMEVAESHPDLVTPVGDWVIATAVAQATVWHRGLGDRAPKMWVNISCDQLVEHPGHLPVLVDRLLSAAGLAPDALGLEITERQLIRRVDDAASDLAALRDMGVSLAVDDFGTGYASLDYLRRFIFDEIKIDKAFVAGLGRDRTDTAVTASIIDLGRSLDLNVVAEGVETPDQYDHLEDLGCAMAQGYLMHRPATAEMISHLLEGTTEARGGAPSPAVMAWSRGER